MGVEEWNWNLGICRSPVAGEQGFKGKRMPAQQNTAVYHLWNPIGEYPADALLICAATKYEIWGYLRSSSYNPGVPPKIPFGCL